MGRTTCELRIPAFGLALYASPLGRSDLQNTSKISARSFDLAQLLSPPSPWPVFSPYGIAVRPFGHTQITTPKFRSSGLSPTNHTPISLKTGPAYCLFGRMPQKNGFWGVEKCFHPRFFNRTTSSRRLGHATFDSDHVQWPSHC